MSQRKTAESLLESLFNPPRKPGEVRATRGTGMWPFVKPRPWNLTPTPDEAVFIDGVAVASEAASELVKVGWPGISLMDSDFQMALIDAPEGTTASLVETWFASHRDQVCETIEKRLAGYDVDGLSSTAKIAMEEALIAYKEGLYLSVVRVLLPEFECFARALVRDKTQRFTQKKVIEDLKELLGHTPVIKDDPLESFSLFHFIEEHLFAQCFTEVDAQAFGSVPNRHAEMHGFASYGTLQGATTLVCVMDYLLRMMARLKGLGAFKLTSVPSS